MSLTRYDGKKVKIVNVNGEVFFGTVTDYVFPEDNEPEEESIIVDALDNEYPIEFYAKDIETIEMIK